MFRQLRDILGQTEKMRSTNNFGTLRDYSVSLRDYLLGSGLDLLSNFGGSSFGDFGGDVAEPRNLLSVNDLGRDEVLLIFAVADLFSLLREDFFLRHGSEVLLELRGLLSSSHIMTIFFEPSTRTRASFEVATKCLGGNFYEMNISTSSESKGETLLDTALTLRTMKPDILIVRHFCSGAPFLLSRKLDCTLFNAGDGVNEHPTQALLDLYTIINNSSSLISELKIVICGDVLHSRVARSAIMLFKHFGSDVHLVGPPPFLPKDFASFGVKLHTNLPEALAGADIVMALRIQDERLDGFSISSKEEFRRHYMIDSEVLSLAKPGVLVMHPGPINRGIEISSEVADSSRSLIRQQTHNGVCIRSALLYYFLRLRRGAPGLSNLLDKLALLPKEESDGA